MSTRAALAVIFMTVLLDAIGIGLIMPVMPDLLTEVTGAALGDAALWGGVMATSFAAMQFLFGPALGQLSDAIGRRPVLIVSLIVMAGNYLALALAQTLTLLIVARLVSGIAAATQSTAFAYIADISTSETKAQRFGLIGAAFGLGFVLGPAMGGLLGSFGPRAPFYAAAALALLNAGLAAVILRETVSEPRPFIWREANPFAAFTAFRRLPGLGPLMAVFTLYAFAGVVYPAIWAFFTKARFDWDARTIGLSLALYGLAMAAVQGGLIRVALRHIGPAQLVLWGLLFDIGMTALIGLVWSGPALLVLTPLAALSALVEPALQSLMSDRAETDRQGALQGTLSSLRALTVIIGPLAMTGLFALGTRPGGIWFPAAPFMLSVALLLLALIVVRRARA